MRLNTLMAIGLGLGCSIVQASDITSFKSCTALTAPEISSVAPLMNGKLVGEVYATFTPKNSPAFLGSLRVDDCNSAMSSGGAVPMRISLYTADRELTPAQWSAVDKAVLELAERTKPSGAQNFGELRCSSDALPGTSAANKATKSKISSAYCELMKGKYMLTVTVEHEDASKLPALNKLAAVTNKAAANLQLLAPLPAKP